LLDKNDIKELVDPSLGDNYDTEEMDRVVLTASMCIEQSPILRPRMNQASTAFKTVSHRLPSPMIHLSLVITISVDEKHENFTNQTVSIFLEK
jgi:hypothetical protein